MKDLIEVGTLTPELAAQFEDYVTQRKNILICGGTSSGKTTLANVLTEFIPDHERIVLIEDTAEIQIHKENVLRFEARREQNGLPAVTIRDLLKATCAFFRDPLGDRCTKSAKYQWRAPVSNILHASTSWRTASIARKSYFAIYAMCHLWRTSAQPNLPPGGFMKRNSLSPIMMAVTLFAVALFPDVAPKAQQKNPTGKEKMTTVNYLVGSWSCAHMVGTFSGKYTTTYTKVLGDLWLRQTYDFPPGQFGDTGPAVTAEALIGYDENRGQWVRFFATSHGEYFSIRMKDIGDGWAYRYVSFFGSKPERAEPDATFTKKSDTEYLIDGPTYPENGTQVTEHHNCHKL
jgi:energy-coupling factor transporter ATP-binding protein EcfA2